MASPGQLTRHHATAFLDPGCSGLVEELCRTWDPLMAQQIAAHITLIYPQEITDPVLIHVIEDTARHFGHMDILCELIDGQAGDRPQD